jgi:uncharacterized protein (DUF2141 family)
MRRFFLALIGLLILTAPAARAAKLIVTIDHVTGRSGVVRVIVISHRDGTARQDTSRNLPAAKARNGTIATTFLGLSPGRYSVIATHDENVNHALQQVLTGSINAPQEVSPEAKVTLAEPATKVTLTLR